MCYQRTTGRGPGSQPLRLEPYEHSISDSERRAGRSEAEGDMKVGGKSACMKEEQS